MKIFIKILKARGGTAAAAAAADPARWKYKMDYLKQHSKLLRSWLITLYGRATRSPAPSFVPHFSSKYSRKIKDADTKLCSSRRELLVYSKLCSKHDWHRFLYTGRGGRGRTLFGAH